MQLTYEDLDVLIEIQKIDLEVMQLKKKRGQLPQRIQVVKVRKKRDELEPKLEQVIGLQKAIEAQITKVEDEDRGLAEKQQRSQELIESSSSDFRKVESHSKEMAGVAKRRVTLEETMKDLTVQLDKISDARNQIEAGIAALTAEEQRLKDDFATEDAELLARISQLMGMRAELEANLPDGLLELYDKTAKKTGGVALGKLVDNACGVCRSVIDSGHLISLRSQAPLGVCPSCKRLLIVDAD